MTTIQDIADKMGVSKSTVSKALNDAPDISEALRKQVLETAVALGYTKLRRYKKPTKKVCIIICLLYTSHFIFQADDSDHLLCALFSPETDILFHTSMEQLLVMAKITDHAVPVCFFHFSKFFSAEGDASLIRRRCV